MQQHPPPLKSIFNAPKPLPIQPGASRDRSETYITLVKINSTLQDIHHKKQGGGVDICQKVTKLAWVTTECDPQTTVWEHVTVILKHLIHYKSKKIVAEEWFTFNGPCVVKFSFIPYGGLEVCWCHLHRFQTWALDDTTCELQIWPQSGTATCISCKFGHQAVLPLALVANLATKYQVATLALPHCLGLPSWYHQGVGIFTSRSHVSYVFATASRLPCYVFCICMYTYKQMHIRNTNQLSWAFNWATSWPISWTQIYLGQTKMVINSIILGTFWHNYHHKKG